LAVTGVLLGGPCIACANPVTHQGPPPCCDHSRDCRFPSRAPGGAPIHAYCASPSTDFSFIEQTAAEQISHALVPADTAEGPAGLLPHRPDADPPVHRIDSSPPSLCLFSSVLNV